MHRRMLIVILITLLTTGCAVTASAPSQSDQSKSPISTNAHSEPDAERSYPAGGDKWDLWVDGPHLRGANIWQAVVVPELDGLEFKGPGPVGPPFTQADFDALAALGANYVSISGPGLFTETPPYQVDQGVQENLDDLLVMIEAADMFATIGFRTGPGRSEFTLCCEGDSEFNGYFDDSVWEDKTAQEAWGEMWRYTAGRYRDNPIVVGYKLMVEPNAPGIFFDIYEPDDFYQDYAGTSYDWNQLYPHIVEAIRQVDESTPILVGGTGWSGVSWLPSLVPLDDPRIVYVVHQYEPQEMYTHQEPPLRNAYPGELDTDYDGEDEQFDKDWLDSFLNPVEDFMAITGAPVVVDEFGAIRWEPGAAQFLEDQIGLFEALGLNHAIWEWSPTWPPFASDVHEMNYRYGPDPENRRDDLTNEVLNSITRYWEQNEVRPSSYYRGNGETSIGNPDLGDVRTWLYLIDVNLDDETVDQITSSSYDMVVLDYLPSEKENTDYPMDEVIEHIQNASHPKLVLAYIDIGEAESYRTYWQDGWRVGDPAWIAGEDPDGWEGNFPVAYWDEAWRDIWLGENGYLQGIIVAGFDGVYLDWVEAYSDENVIALAEEEGVDPIDEMIGFVADIAEYGRERSPGFVVIAQNAAELAQIEEYVDAIDATAQEQVWFDGGADNDPPGDCPLPRTEASVDSDSYHESLSRVCRRQFDDYPESTLHVSSEWYLEGLQAAQEEGLIIFTVDYALEPENVALVYEVSRASGFVPFVSTRALDQFIPPYP
ncbi:MAG: cellulase family glycosylhydrolase [Anaerolineales bacterium]